MSGKNFWRALVLTGMAIVVISLANNLPTIVRQEPLGAEYVSPQPNIESAARIGIPAVVYIVTKIDKPQYYLGPEKTDKDGLIRYSGGSGVLYTSDGYIVTNSHVIQRANHQAKKIVVTLSDGRVFNAKIIGNRPAQDLAILKIQGTNLPFLTLGNSNSLIVGQSVLTIGNPYGFRSSVSAGIISNPRREVTEREAYIQDLDIDYLIQVDASINPGNSGGALVDLQGRLIGIACSVYSRSGGFEGIGFAIPEDLVRKTIRSITGQVFL